MNYKYTALTIETRKHKALEFVLNNICDSLSHDWKILLFHGINNKEYANEIVTRLNIKFNNRICLIGLNIDTFDLTEYSKFLATKSVIYDYIDTEIFLIFQTDSIIFFRLFFINIKVNSLFTGLTELCNNSEKKFDNS